MSTQSNVQIQEKVGNLTYDDLAYLVNERHIPYKWALENCKSMDESEAGVMLGYPAKSAGIMLISAEYGQWQFRPTNPWASQDSKKPPKYRTPKGEYDAFLSKHPEIKDYWSDLEALKARCFTIDGKPYILLTEGGFKGIVGCANDIPTLAFAGVTLVLTPKAKGEPELLPAVKRLVEAGFNFIFAFDADFTSNPAVRAAQERLTKVLRSYGCDVKSISGHWEESAGKGMDDFINNKGIEAFRAILMQAAPICEPRDTVDSKKTKKPPTRREVATRLAEQYGDKWKYDNEQKTWRVWTGKCWEKAEIGAFRSLVKTTIDAKGIGYDGIEYINNVIELLQCDLRQLKWQFWDKSRYINFNNCVFDGAKAESVPHSPGMGFTSHLPYDYKPIEGDLGDSLEALRVNCPKVHKFLRTAMKGDERKMFKLLAIINALLKYRFFDLQMFVHLVGAPGSGKGKFMRFCQKLVGKPNSIACQLDKLGDGSTKASLMDKQLVVFPDERKPVGIDSILSLTGGDEISYRELYQPAASAHFYGSLMIASNKPIFIGDTTGLERRLCLVNFDNPIAVEERKHSLEQELDSEIPACIAIALSLTDDAVTQAIQGIGSSQIVEFKAKEWQMKVEVNSVAAFFDTELVLDPTATTRVGKLYDAYKYFCEEGGLSKFSIVKFPRLLSDIFTDENLPVTRHQGAHAYFEGVRMRDNSDTHPTHSETLNGFEGVGEGVLGSYEGVKQGVEPPPDKGLRELRELSPKLSSRSENDDNYLPDSDESDKEEDLPPSTPSTPSKVVPASDTTPLATPINSPKSSPQLPETQANKHLTSTPADEMREVLTSNRTTAEKRTAAREVWKQFERVPLSQRGQQRGLFWKNLEKTGQENKARLLVFTDLSEGEKLHYVGSEEQYQELELTAYSADGTGGVTITCKKPDGYLTTWIPMKHLRRL